jgi:single-stranded-DNA-specific exonuclease
MSGLVRFWWSPAKVAPGVIGSLRRSSWTRSTDLIVLSVDGDEAHGSGRSIPRFDLLGALERCGHLFARFGGHKQAAGLTMDRARIKELRHAINEVADETLGPEDLMPRLRIDADLTFRGITASVAAGVASLAPFGAGNPQPVFAARWRSSTVHRRSRTVTSR